MAPPSAKPGRYPTPPPRPMGPLYPSRRPATGPVAAPPKPWHHQHPALATVLTLAVLAALLAAFTVLVAPQAEAEADALDVVYVRYQPSYPGIGYVHIDDHRDYRNYLNVSVHPMLTQISVAFADAACSGAEGDRDGMVDGLGRARAAAAEALEEAKRVVPPLPLQSVHNEVKQAFAATVTAADSIADCLTSRGSAQRCQEAQEDTQALMDEVLQATRDVQSTLKAAPAAGASLPGGLP